MSCIPEEMQATFELHLISQYAHNWKAPLFYLIEEILKNAEDPLNSALLLAKVKLIAGGPAYLFDTADPSIQHTPLFSGLNVQFEKHYRVDNNYKIGTGTQHGLTSIHYTEIYNIYNRDRTLAEKILIFQ